MTPRADPQGVRAEPLSITNTKPLERGLPARAADLAWFVTGCPPMRASISFTMASPNTAPINSVQPTWEAAAALAPADRSRWSLRERPGDAAVLYL